MFGVIDSVRPLTNVPCTMLASVGENSNSSSSRRNLMGFFVEVICCECELCSSKTVLTDLTCLMADWSRHCFNKLVVLYFIENASSWHSVIAKLCGDRVVVVSGLKRKMVFMGKEESRIMYVTTDESVLHVGPLSKKCLPCLNMDTKGKGKFGTYTGIVRGVYMQGMVIELDRDVWLLLTNQNLTLPHSLRVGAIVSKVI